MINHNPLQIPYDDTIDSLWRVVVLSGDHRRVSVTTVGFTPSGRPVVVYAGGLLMTLTELTQTAQFTVNRDFIGPRAAQDFPDGVHTEHADGLPRPSFVDDLIVQLGGL